MKKRKVLQISNYYTPHIGGIEQTCQYLSEGIKDEYDIRVICFSEDKETKHQKTNGIEVTKPGVLLNIARQGISLSYYFYLKKLIRKWQPDIIHLHYPNPFVVALLLPLIPSNIKLYVQWHLDITKQKKIYPFVRPIETRMLRRADLIAPTSPNYRDSSQPLIPFRDKTSVLPSAIDTNVLDLRGEDFFILADIKKRAANKKIVFFVGRHVLHKGLLYLIEAEKLVKNDCVFYIGGEGPLTEELQRLNKSSRIIFVGKLTEQEKRCYYHAADIFAFPSYTKAEGFGLTLAEAMYCKAVPITYTIEGSGVNWVSLNGVTGIEVPNKNIHLYAEAIDFLLSNDNSRKVFAENAHKRVVENFTIKKEIELLKTQYRNLFL
ncbi:MAG: glycosyltransferase [Bacteroidaceae bacterium]|nr:glycosyltransferase [Bacteroidaceae bacterium]